MTGMEVVMTSYFAEPEFAGLFSSSPEGDRRRHGVADHRARRDLAGERVIDLCSARGWSRNCWRNESAPAAK